MRLPQRLPVVLPSRGRPAFPDPGLFDGDGLVAIGGDLRPERLLLAYRRGIFPWYADGSMPMWWSPDPRAVLSPSTLHVSHSLARVIRRGGFALTWNRCFRAVMAECGKCRTEGTWVIDEMLDAYTELHARGSAHSLEVWHDERLVGGIYGVQVGGLFAAESMFHRRADMSKVALVALVRSLFRAGIELFDVQFLTPHLQTMGAELIRRAEYLRRLGRAVRRRPRLLQLVASPAPA
jgi:leucyl/phenylalanyl-tRNA--protein transferase